MDESHRKLLKRLNNAARQCADRLERLKGTVDGNIPDLQLYGNYGREGARASARLLFLLHELRGLQADTEERIEHERSTEENAVSGN